MIPRIAAALPAWLCRGKSRTGLFLTASPARALIEVVLVSVACYCLAYLAWPAPGGDTFPLFTAATLWCAFRQRLPAGAWWRKILVEGAVMLAANLIQTAVESGFRSLYVAAGLLDSGAMLVQFSGVELNFIGSTIFISLRAVVRLGLALDRRRRKHLRWTLTSALLTVFATALLSAGTIGSAITVRALAEDIYGSVVEHADAAAVIVGLLLMVPDLITQLAMLMLLPLVLLTPPFLLFSYVVARRITGRVEKLADATAALRAGDYAARSPVAGEDEIAQLQTDFNAMADDLQRTLRDLANEQEKSERLLLNILPGPIAERLKHTPGLIADSFAEVTVLFADIVDFTPQAGSLAPETLVAWLNEVFSAFDLLVEEHGVEKVKTIGDAYMVVAGLPTPRPDHAAAIAELALNMQEALAGITTPDGKPALLRIGINTGPVVAGVVGTKKFLYDLWGDAVNLASRMESQGVAGAIQASEATYLRLCEHYTWAERGLMPIKGKGELRTYLLLGRIAGEPEQHGVSSAVHGLAS
jgi:class 3 adenylate cyclase